MVSQNEPRAAQQIEEAHATIERAIRRSSGDRRAQLTHINDVLSKIIVHLNDLSQ